MMQTVEGSSRRSPEREGAHVVLEARARLVQIEDLIRIERGNGTTTNAIALRLLREGRVETLDEARGHIAAFDKAAAEQHARIVSRVRRVVAANLVQVLLAGAVVVLVLLLIDHPSEGIWGDVLISAFTAMPLSAFMLIRIYRARKDEKELERVALPRPAESAPWENPDALLEVDEGSRNRYGKASIEAQRSGIRPM